RFKTVTSEEGKRASQTSTQTSSLVVIVFIMKAISPVRSVRNCYKAVCCISEQSLAISRNKHSCLEEPVGALCDMNDCYSKLKELVPSIPQNQSVSQVEILQHVIDYIFDLQIALEAEDAAAPEMVLSIKTADLTRNFSKEEGRLCH
ncbi:DNA-binding protein inhibitor ID-3-A, partial [Larimichthys crocea]